MDNFVILYLIDNTKISDSKEDSSADIPLSVLKERLMLSDENQQEFNQ